MQRHVVGVYPGAGAGCCVPFLFGRDQLTSVIICTNMFVCFGYVLLV